MNNKQDLTDFFQEWPYESDKIVRFLVGNDGREILQVRQPLGVEQYEMDGRPDGFKPEGEASFLDLFMKRADDVRAEGQEFVLSDDDFFKLQSEGILFYHRYIVFFQIGLYDRVLSDTEHNLAICHLLETCYQHERRNGVLQFYPYIRRVNAIALAMMNLADDDNRKALENLERGRKDIQSLVSVPTDVFEFEMARSIEHIDQIINSIRNTVYRDNHPHERNLREELTRQLQDAVEVEDYERAAKLRDSIRDLE